MKSAQRREEEARKRAVRSLAKKISTTGQQCQDCGATEGLHRHHPDYSRPMYVEFLCPKCHNARHPRVRKCAERDKALAEVYAKFKSGELTRARAGVLAAKYGKDFSDLNAIWRKESGLNSTKREQAA